MKLEYDCSRFTIAMELFVAACPGSPLVNRALRFAALEHIDGAGEEYPSSVMEVAMRLRVDPDRLSLHARRRGLSLPRAFRWIRFLRGVWLLTEGHRVRTVARKLGFPNVAGWRGFTRRLLGRSPHEFPAMDLEGWVRMAIQDVCARAAASGRMDLQPQRHRRSDRDQPDRDQPEV